MKQTRISRVAGTMAVAGIAFAAFAPTALGGMAPSGKFGSVDSFKVGKFNVYVNGGEQGGGINVSKGGLSAGYFAETKSSATHIKANLKSFGEVDIKFNGEGKFKKQKKPRGCTGTPGKVQKGTWKGKIKFKGEGGYVKVDENSAKGRLFKPGNLECPINPGGSKYVNLGANGDALFSASVKKSGGKPSFSAFFGEQKQGISISRTASTKGKASAFTYDNSYNHAEVKPGGPFKGKGVYNAVAKGQSTGTFGEFSGLKVSFLGKKNVSLNSDSANLGESQFRPR